MGKSSALTVVDVDNTIRRNFAPDVEKLVSEIEMNLGDHAALCAIGARVVADHGQSGFRKVEDRINAIHAEEFSNPEAVDLIVGGARWVTTKGAIARRRFDGLYRGACGKRKKTTKAEAIARHIDALVNLLRNEPDTIVWPILDSLLERIQSGSGCGGQQIAAYVTAEQIVADCLFEAQGDAAKAQRLARDYIVGEEAYEKVAA